MIAISVVLIFFASYAFSRDMMQFGFKPRWSSTVLKNVKTRKHFISSLPGSKLTKIKLFCVKVDY